MNKIYGLLVTLGICLSTCCSGQVQDIVLKPESIKTKLFYELGYSYRIIDNVNSGRYLGIDFNLGYRSKKEGRSFTGVYGSFSLDNIGSKSSNTFAHYGLNTRFEFESGNGDVFRVSPGIYSIFARNPTLGLGVDLGYTLNKHIDLYVKTIALRQSSNLQDPSFVYLVNGGIRTKNKAAVWTTGVMTVLYGILALRAIGNSK